MAPPEARIAPESSNAQTVRILVLETDETHPETQQEKGGFGEILNELLTTAGRNHSPQLGIETLMQYIVEPEGGKVLTADEITDDIHAILITGSTWDAHGDDEWILKLMTLIRELWQKRSDIRFTGICFGHQIICRTLGSKVKPEPDGEWELAHTPIRLSGIGQKLFGLPESERQIHLHQMHMDYVAEPPTVDENELLSNDQKVHVWGESDHTGVQGIYIHKRVFTTQGHMEFNETAVKRQLEMRVDAGSVSKEDADEAAEKADWEHDGLVVAKAVLRFFHGDDDDVE